MECAKMVNVRQLLGRRGEQSAAKFLREKGYSILKQNYRCHHGEIDIIAKEGDTIVFVEVKTRSSKAFGGPAAAVNYRKQQQISKAAFTYLEEQQLNDVDSRFDVISILAEDDKQLECKHLPDAFEFTIS